MTEHIWTPQKSSLCHLRSSGRSNSLTLTTQTRFETSQSPIVTSQNTVLKEGFPNSESKETNCDVTEPQYGITMLHCDVTGPDYEITMLSCDVTDPIVTSLSPIVMSLGPIVTSQSRHDGITVFHCDITDPTVMSQSPIVTSQSPSKESQCSTMMSQGPIMKSQCKIVTPQSLL